MLGYHNYKNYSGMLNNFLDIVENDTSSILYHTRVLDEAVLNGILNFYNNNNFEVVQQNTISDSFDFFIFVNGKIATEIIGKQGNICFAPLFKVRHTNWKS